MNRQKELDTILELHKKYLRGDKDGVRANLSGANLFEVNLYGADLSGANLSGADLFKASLSKANLFNANLFGADLRRANLYRADLSRADLRGADLRGADLSGVDLSGANLHKAILPYPVFQAYLGQYHAWTEKDKVHIGCECRTVQEWLDIDIEQAEALGLDTRYYEEYMQFIQMYNKFLAKQSTDK